MKFKSQMNAQPNPGITKNIESWLNNINALQVQKRYKVGEDDQRYVTKFVMNNTPETFAILFRRILNKRWPKQNLKYDNNGTRTNAGLFRVVFTGEDVRLEFDSIETGRAIDREIWVYFECQWTKPKVSDDRIMPVLPRPESSSYGDMCSCIVS